MAPRTERRIVTSLRLRLQMSVCLSVSGCKVANRVVCLCRPGGGRPVKGLISAKDVISRLKSLDVRFGGMPKVLLTFLAELRPTHCKNKIRC